MRISPPPRRRLSRRLAWGAMLFLVLGWGLAWSAAAPAYVRSPDVVQTDGTPVYRIWGARSQPIHFVINRRTREALPNVEAGSDAVGALRAAFAAWQGVPTTSIAFVDDGFTDLESPAFDQVNLVSMVDSQNDLGPGVLGLTITVTAPEGGNVALPGGGFIPDAFPGEILDGDIIFNRTQLFSTLGSAGANDLQSVATHEIGHLLGLDHTTLLTATMLPFTPEGSVYLRSLDFDDVFAVSTLYPGTGAANIAPRRGGITGRITSRAGEAVFGANVVAVDAFGRSLTNALSLPDGNFTLQALFPGSYTLFVEPLDGPVTSENFLNFFTEFASFGATTSEFPTLFLGGAEAPTPISVQARQTQTVNLEVEVGRAPGLNIGQLGVITIVRSGTSIRTSIRSASVVPVEPGSELILSVMGPGISGGTRVSTSDPGIAVSPAPNETQGFASFFNQFGGGVAVTVRFPAAMPPGGRNVIASNGADVAVAVNALEVSGAPEFDNPTEPPAPAPAAPPEIALELNQPSFTSGATLQVTGRTSPGSPEAADLYLAVLLPNNALLFLGESIGPSPSPLRRALLVSSGSERLFSFQFSGAEPRGSYQFFAAFTRTGANPLTEGVLGEIASASFSVR
ncbi:MAG: matrixin family metalloprotease [Candidatus Tectomicrobia bacterium]|nr:matrixin family metalloprotease [Candidatus Tectomicrobia bacterium]